jgi:hypothetical protein
MKIRVKTKADIDKKHPELCSWACDYVYAQVEGRGSCILFDQRLEWVTLPGGKEALKRCRQCLVNTLRG